MFDACYNTWNWTTTFGKKQWQLQHMFKFEFLPKLCQAWHQKRFGVITNLQISHLCFFGYVAFINVPKEIRTKLNFKAIKCIFISYSEEIKRYKLDNPISHYVIISHDVIFYGSKNFDGKTIGSNLNSRLEHLVWNWKLEIKDEKVPQNMVLN
jgi:hypothetical protein